MKGSAVLESLQRKYPGARPRILTLPSESNRSWQVLTRVTDGARERSKFIARADTGEVVGPVDGVRVRGDRARHRAPARARGRCCYAPEQSCCGGRSASART